MGLEKGLRAFLEDLCSIRLWLIKITYFTMMAGVIVLWPQFTIHQQALGLTIYQTGICSSVVSSSSILITILAGLIGDKLGNYKIFMSVLTALAGVIYLVFTIVPSARMTGNTSSNTTTNNNNTFTNGTINMTTAEVDPQQLIVTFWSYLVVRTTFGALYSSAFMLYEAAVMAHVQKHGINFGFQRVWSTLAIILSSLLSGYLVQLTGSFSTIFYVSAALLYLSAGLMLFLSLEFKLPTQSLTKEIFKYLKNSEVIVFLFAMLAAGVFVGYLEAFMHRFLFNLGASNVLVSLTVTVGAPFEMVLTLATSFFVRLFGHTPLIMIGLLAHSIRFMGFSLLVDPWWVLPLEVMDSVAVGLFTTAAVMYCTVLFSLETIASFRGALSVLYYGLGPVLGSLLGGQVRETLGDRAAFRVMSVVAGTCFLAYLVAYLALKKRRT